MNYKYKAIDKDGKSSKGYIEAKDISDFYLQINLLGMICISVREAAAGKDKNVKTIYKLRMKDLVLFCRKMSAMLSSGMGITATLNVLHGSAENKKEQELYLAMFEAIQQGVPLSETMRNQGQAFPSMLINMVESGEATGNIDEIMERLSVYYEGQSKIQAKVQGATVYPIILAVVAFAVILILFTFVLPQMFTMFDNVELPTITKVMLAISEFFGNYLLFVLIGIGVLVVFFKNLYIFPNIQLLADKIKIRVPVIGKLNAKIYSARFANTMAILYASGISVINSVRITSNVLMNSYIRSKFGGIIENISSGNPLSDSLDDVGVFDNLLPSMVRIGEESGTLDSVLVTTAQYFDLEAEKAIEKMLSLLEPVLLIVMAIIIGTVIISVMLPMYALYGSFGV